ncbi:hypothetical protein BsWGS_09194 [Bradybaena similaris]
MMFKHVVFVICTVLFADNGAAEEPSTGIVAFFANIKVLKRYAANDIVKFDNVVTNEGNAYNKDSGIFTATKPGLYVFHFNALSEYGTTFLFDLIHNDEILASAYEKVPSSNGQGGNSVIVRVKSGDHVYVRAKDAAIIYNSSDRPYATFSGYYLGEYKSC